MALRGQGARRAKADFVAQELRVAHGSRVWGAVASPLVPQALGRRGATTAGATNAVSEVAVFEG